MKQRIYLIPPPPSLASGTLLGRNLLGEITFPSSDTSDYPFLRDFLSRFLHRGQFPPAVTDSLITIFSGSSSTLKLLKLDQWSCIRENVPLSSLPYPVPRRSYYRSIATLLVIHPGSWTQIPGT
jgi:hypothetical protein